MASQYWEILLNAPPSAGPGTAYSTSVTLTDVSPAPQYSLPAGSLQPGSVLRWSAFGVFSTTGTPTLLLGFYYGGVAGALPLATTGAVTTGTTLTNVPFRIQAETVVRTNGAAGTAMTQGAAWLGTSVSAWSTLPIPNTALATVAIDTTTAKQLTLGAQWGTNSASNTLTCHSFLVELLD